jgi:hypothetical protein
MMDFDNEEFMKKLLDQLENTSWDQYMNLCYNVIAMFPEQVLHYDEKTAKHKIQSLERILLHFEEKEDFEKCAKIKEIQDHLKNC